MDANDLSDWWKRNGAKVPSWNRAAGKFLLMRPSSAAMERVFSLYQYAISDFQLNTSPDVEELRIQLSLERKQRQQRTN